MSDKSFIEVTGKAEEVLKEGIKTMGIIFERKINYYETDRMGVVHHSNYIRFLEEARTYWLEQIDMPFSMIEKEGITIPVLAVDCEYKRHVTFGDTIRINTYMKEYNGVRMTVGYQVTNKETNEVVMRGETKHCFTNQELRPISLKKVSPEFHRKFESLLEEG